MKPTHLILSTVLLGITASPLSAQTEVTIVKPEAGPGVPAPVRTEEISTTEATTFSDGSQKVKSKLELRAIPPARVQNRVVVDSAGLTIATVERVIEDPAGKGIRYLVVADQERKYIIPAGAFTLGERDGEMALQLAVEPARLAGAPAYVEARQADYLDKAGAQPVYSYWNVEWDD